MIHTTATRHTKDYPTKAVSYLDTNPVHYALLIHKAQSEVGRDIGKEIKTGTQWISTQIAKFWRACSAYSIHTRGKYYA